MSEGHKKMSKRSRMNLTAPSKSDHKRCYKAYTKVDTILTGGRKIKLLTFKTHIM